MYITSAAPDLQHLIGSRIVGFDGATPDQVLEVADRYYGNDHPANPLGGGGFFRWPSALHALGIARHADRIELTLAKSGKTSRMTVAVRAWSAPRKIVAPSTASTPVPLWLSNQDAMFWTNRVTDNTLYVQINNLLNTPQQSLAQFGVRLRTELDSSRVTNLIVDLRRNNGGNSYLYRELLRTLIAFDARPNTQVYVITDRQTFSATANFVTEVDRLTDALFVGVPAAGVPIQYGGDAAEIVLPYSGVRAGITTVVYQLTSPRDSRAFVAPDIPTPLTSADYFANRDPALETILALVRAQS